MEGKRKVEGLTIMKNSYFRPCGAFVLLVG